MSKPRLLRRCTCPVVTQWGDKGWDNTCPRHGVTRQQETGTVRRRSLAGGSPTLDDTTIWADR